MILGDFFWFPDRAGDVPAAQKTAVKAACLRKVRRFMLIPPILTEISHLLPHETIPSFQLPAVIICVSGMKRQRIVDATDILTHFASYLDTSATAGFGLFELDMSGLI